MSSQQYLVISYFFHLLATVVWLGGLAILVVMVYPETRRILADQPALYALLSRLRKRFTPFANFSLAVLVASGMVQMALDPNYTGVLRIENTWSVALLLKHIAVGLLALCSLGLQYGVAPMLERTTLLLASGKSSPEEWERLHRRERQLTWLSVFFGVLILGFTAWMTAL